MAVSLSLGLTAIPASPSCSLSRGRSRRDRTVPGTEMCLLPQGSKVSDNTLSMVDMQITHCLRIR